MELSKRTLSHIQERRQRILEGKVNSIPSPFIRFANDFLGIEQGKYYLITGGTKSAKTQLSTFLFVYTPLFYAYQNPNKIRLKIFYYNLEESTEDIMQRFMCFLLYIKSEHKIHISPTDLISSHNNKVVKQEIIDTLGQEEYTKILEFFEKTVIFSDIAHPTGIFKECKEYAENNGKIFKKKKTYRDELNQLIEHEVFDYYVPNDPEEYRIIFIDHVSLLTTEKDLTLKQTIDRLSEYCVQLRNRYKMIPVVIQQQALAQEGNDSIRLNKIRPSLTNLSDSKYTVRDCNVALGIFSPMRFELESYQGYNIKILKDHIRFLEVLVNRGSSPGGLIALYFDGAVNYFKELPHPVNQFTELEQVYKSIQKNEICLLTKISNNMSYLIGSHNSWSYLKPRKWYLRPFHFIAKCQSKTIKEQYNDYNVRVFDLRVKWDKNSLVWRLAHGVITFDMLAMTALDELATYCQGNKSINVRVILEYNKTPNEDIQDKFKVFCDEIAYMFPMFNFFCGILKSTGEILYDFKQTELSLTLSYSSTTSLFNISQSSKYYNILKVLDDWWPWIYAKLYNKKHYSEGTTRDCLFLDFVNIK